MSFPQVRVQGSPGLMNSTENRPQCPCQAECDECALDVSEVGFRVKGRCFPAFRCPFGSGFNSGSGVGGMTLRKGPGLWGLQGGALLSEVEGVLGVKGVEFDARMTWEVRGLGLCHFGELLAYIVCIAGPFALATVVSMMLCPEAKRNL